jgi:hypothetical protein
LKNRIATCPVAAAVVVVVVVVVAAVSVSEAQTSTRGRGGIEKYLLAISLSKLAWRCLISKRSAAILGSHFFGELR